MRVIAIILCLIFSTIISAQQLLLNGGFEEKNTCTEYRIECAPEAWISSANNFINYFKDAKRAYKGNHCMAIEAGNFQRPYSRTFFRSRLVCGLRKGNQYRISFNIKSPFDLLDSVGISFTAADPLLDKSPVHRRTPGICFNHIMDTLSRDSAWKKMEIIYTADGNEHYISFGYFAKDDFFAERSHPLENRYFVFFDEIKMEPVEPNEGICEGWQASKEDIYDENERHEYLDRKIRHYRTNPPPPIIFHTTTYTVIDTLVLPDILFEIGKADLQSKSFPMLDSFCKKLMAATIDSVIVEGHTDSTGSSALNEKLSMARAASVKNYLQSKTGHRNIHTRGMSFLRPVADNYTAEGRQQNRRVEVFLYIRE